MARTGRPPKPTALKLIDGNPGKRKIEPEAKVAPGKPVRPRDLSPEARREWDRLVDLLPETLLQRCDAYALRSLAVAIVRCRQAEKLIDAEGLTAEGVQGIKEHPAVGTEVKYRNLVDRLGAQFGLSPVARARLTIPDAPDEELADLLTPANRRRGASS